MKKLTPFLVTLSLSLPLLAMAQSNPPLQSGAGAAPLQPGPGSTGLQAAPGTPTVPPNQQQQQNAGTPPAAPSAQAHLDNPLNGVNSISDLFYKIANFIVSLSYVVIAFFLILSGFKFVKARGNETELEKAKATFKYTIIGAFLIVGAQTIIAIVKNII